MDLDSLERNILRAESVLVLLAIGLVAAADYLVGPGLSLGPLYLIPLSYSALSHRLATFVSLVVVCVLLRQLFGPLGNATEPWMSFLRDLGIALLFVVTVGLLRRLGRQRRRIFEVARRQRDELAHDLDVAASVQRRLMLLNEPPVSELDIAVKTEPLRGVNGDYYDFIDLGGRSSGIVIADVAGKGLPAALLMPALRFGTRSLITGNGDLADDIRRLNVEFCQTTETHQYGTLVYAQLDLDTGRIAYVNAGHNPPILVRASGEWRELTAGGPPVGLLEDGRYQTGEATLEPGGLLLLYTDGVTEAVSPEGEELGSDRLIEIAVERREATAREVVEAVLDRVRIFLDGAPPDDDTTVIALKRPR